MSQVTVNVLCVLTLKSTSKIIKTYLLLWGLYRLKRCFKMQCTYKEMVVSNIYTFLGYGNQKQTSKTNPLLRCCKDLISKCLD